MTDADSLSPPTLSKARITNFWAKLCTFVCAAALAILTVGLILVLARQSAPFFQAVGWQQFLSGAEWRPNGADPKFGVLPLLCGSLTITVGAALIAIPLGLMSAIYLSEYAGARRRSMLKLPLELLAGIPTVVYGYIGLFYVTPLLRHFSSGFQASNACAAAIVVGLMLLPMVSSLSEDAIHSVPRSLREGGYALGLTRAEVILTIVIPSALSGIGSSFILAIARALGETMAVTLAAGSTPNLTMNPQMGMATMTSYMVTTSQGEAAAGSLRQTSVFAVGFTLFVFTLCLNSAAQRLIGRVTGRYA